MSAVNISIDRGVPPPDPKIHKPGIRINYPFRRMKPGDSFLVPLAETHLRKEKLRKRILWASRAFQGKLPVYKSWKFVIEKVRGGVRCWRIQ